MSDVQQSPETAEVEVDEESEPKPRIRGKRAGRSRVRIDMLRDDLNAALFLLDQAEQALVDGSARPAMRGRPVCWAATTTGS